MSTLEIFLKIVDHKPNNTPRQRCLLLSGCNFYCYSAPIDFSLPSPFKIAHHTVVLTTFLRHCLSLSLFLFSDHGHFHLKSGSNLPYSFYFAYHIGREALRQKCPYLELFWSVFSGIQTEYGDILRTFPYSVRMQENKDQNNFEYGHLLPMKKW